MPVGSEVPQPKTTFRPSKEVLDVFWALSDGNDEQRSNGAFKLSSLVENSKEEEKKPTLKYCQDRLVRGLSSGRKFARVGFSVALAQLLRQQNGLSVNDVLSTIKEKLKIVRSERKTKSEVGGIYLGRAFAFSAIVQSDSVKELDGEALSALVEELAGMADKKSYLKAVCNKILEDLVTKVSTDTFGEHIWPKIREKMKQGWESCTLDKISLLLMCRSKFPDVVNKKFLRKHWGFPLFSEDNDDKLLKTILDTVQKTEILSERIIPSMLENDRNVMSVWNGIADKLMTQGKRAESVAQRQILGLKVANKLLMHTDDTDQVLELVLSPPLAKCMFHCITKKRDPLAAAADSVFEQFISKLKVCEANIEDVVKRVWKLEAALAEQETSGRVDLVNSNNFTRLVDMMSRQEAENYTQILVSSVLGTDKWQVISSNPGKKQKQVEWCLRQLQHLCCSQQHTTAQIQRSTLSLFLRLAFFHVNKKTKNVDNCESCVNFEAESSVRKMCETFFYKGLDNLATLNTGQQKKTEHLSSYIELMLHLAQYIQVLMKTESVKAIKEWPNEMQEDMVKLLEFVKKVNKNKKNQAESQSSAFLVLALFLGFHMLTDFTVASELLQDVTVCYDKAEKDKKSKGRQDDGEPHWVEVVTEMLLNLMSLQSHFSRVISATVFRCLSSHMKPSAVSLITEVLMPKKSRGDDAGGVLVDAENDNGNEDDEDISDEEDEPEERSDDENDESDNEEDGADDDEEEEMDEDEKVDDQFRESVKQALGDAADDASDGEEDLPDLSDSEMFKLDDMLAEVFRQRRKAGGKKAREEKKKEMANFRVRVLDLVEILVKGERCGDFLLDVIKPVLLLTLNTSSADSQALGDRARSLFNLLKSKAKGLVDSVHTEKEQMDLFQQLLDVAQSVTDSSHLQDVSVACHIVINLSYGNGEGNAKNEGRKSTSTSPECVRQVIELLNKVITKKQSKPHLSFFQTLIELDPPRFLPVCPVLLQNLREESTKTHSKMICCSLLASLCKKTDNVKESDLLKTRNWMTEAAELAKHHVLSISKEDIKAKLCKDVLTLALALQGRKDVLPQVLFEADVKQHLMEVKPKFDTDLRRLANKIIASIDKDLASGNKTKKKKKDKKRKAEDLDSPKPPAKKQKRH